MIKRTADVLCQADITIYTNLSNGKILDRLTASSGTIETQSRKLSIFGPIDVVVRENETVELRAEHITLQPGFVVEKDGIFNALIEPCK